MARKIDLIVIHCSDTPNGRTLFSPQGGGRGVPGGDAATLTHTGSPGDADFTTPIQEIDRWHRERGFVRQQGWRDKQEPALTSIGYHFVIYTRGAVAACRHLDEIGAHAKGYNAASLGVCLIGRDAFTRAQWDALRDFLCGYAKGVEQQIPPTPPLHPRGVRRGVPDASGITLSQPKGGARSAGGFGVPRRYGNPSPLEARDILARAGIRVVGHRDLDPVKTCPNFNVSAWLDSGMTPPAGQVYLDPVLQPATREA